MALEAGRNVIVEKPFTLTVAEAEELATMARERKLYLFEAISPLHTPNPSLTGKIIFHKFSGCFV